MRIEERIGKRVREAREQMRLTQEELGALTEQWLGPKRKRWSKQTVSAAESGKRAFTAGDLLVLCRVLGKPIRWFFDVGDYTAAQDDHGRITPGPWTVGKAASGTPRGYVWAVVGDTAGPKPVASVVPYPEEEEANARLLAAAPEMAELLARVHTYIPNQDLYDRVRAVLARIRGEA